MRLYREPAMRNFFQKLLSPTPQSPTTCIPHGQRVYAIGDIHGCADLFGDLISAIEADDRARGASETTVILLGDLVDRGPDSRGVIDAARSWSQRRVVRILFGNHEEMFLKSLEDEGVLRQFIRFGGKETILSYGVTRNEYLEMTVEELQAAMAARIPSEDLDFMRGFEDIIVIGDYVFVHAGIRPGARRPTLDTRTVSKPRAARPDVRRTRPHNHRRARRAAGSRRHRHGRLRLRSPDGHWPRGHGEMVFGGLLGRVSR
jgi:hypothetical protein